MAKHLLPNHMTVNHFAKKLSIYPSRIYEHIRKGDIELDTVGVQKTRMIDYKKYKDFPFNKGRNYTKKGVQDWFKKHRAYQKERYYVGADRMKKKKKG